MESSKRSREARRANIIYFLNREGRIDHPHLIRVHHLCHSGVHLRDVKRWLSELRGKEMPDSFAWSYQRRYKMGLLWQDLKDDDLITPISDGEYVLLGSLLPVAESKSVLFPSLEVKISPENGQLDVEDGALPDEEKEEVEQKTSPAGVAGGRSYPRRPSRLFRNFLTCKAVDTVDSTLLAGGGGGVYRSLTKPAGSTRSLLRLQNSHVDVNERESAATGGGKSSRKAGRTHIPMPACSLRAGLAPLHGSGAADDRCQRPFGRRPRAKRGERALAAPAAISSSSGSKARRCNQRRRRLRQQQQQLRREERRGLPSGTIGAEGGERQCGKPFNPEKLHLHMKSCKGFKP